MMPLLGVNRLWLILALVALLAAAFYSVNAASERNQRLHSKCAEAGGLVLYTKAGAIVCVQKAGIIPSESW